MTSGRTDDAYTVMCIVVDADTIRYGASEFKRVTDTPPAPWATVVQTAKDIREAKKEVD